MALATYTLLANNVYKDRVANATPESVALTPLVYAGEVDTSRVSVDTVINIWDVDAGSPPTVTDDTDMNFTVPPGESAFPLILGEGGHLFANTFFFAGVTEPGGSTSPAKDVTVTWYTS